MSDKVLSAMPEFWRSMAALGICFVSTYEWGMPGMVFGLLGDVEEQRQEVLVRMQTLFEKLAALERLACENSDLQSIVMDLAWPRSTCSRELLVGCCETGWSGLPDELHREVLESSHIVSSSKPVEDLFNFCRSATEGVRNGKQSPSQVWHQVMHGPFLGECELAPISITTEDEVGSGKEMPSNSFLAKESEGESSLGADAQKAFFEQMPTCGMSIARYTPASLATHCLLKTEDMQSIGTAWLGLLVVEGYVLYRTGERVVGYVLQTSPCGVLLWEGEAFGAGGYRYFSLRHGGKP